MKPITVKAGSAVVKIYGTPVVSKGKKYPAYTVRYYAEGKPQQKKFGALEGEKGARQYATEAAARINNGSVRALLMTEAQRVEYFNAVDALKVPLRVAVEFYNSRHPHHFQPKTTREVYVEMLLSKKQDKVSDSWYRTLKNLLLRFVQRFPASITELNGADIDVWMRSLNLSGKSRNNFRIAISTMLSFAKARRYIPKDFDELDAVKIQKARGGQIEVFTPEETTKLLNSAPDNSILLVISIGCFAGLRQSEVLRLKWKNVNFEHGILIVEKDTTKKIERRSVPIRPNLLRWLQPFIGSTGPVITAHRTQNAMGSALGRFCAAIEMGWKKNGCRRSSISYDVAECGDIGKVATRHATSIRKINDNYLDLVFPADSERYYGINPPSNYKPVTNKSTIDKIAVI